MSCPQRWQFGNKVVIRSIPSQTLARFSNALRTKSAEQLRHQPLARLNFPRTCHQSKAAQIRLQRRPRTFSSSHRIPTLCRAIFAWSLIATITTRTRLKEDSSTVALPAPAMHRLHQLRELLRRPVAMDQRRGRLAPQIARLGARSRQAAFPSRRQARGHSVGRQHGPKASPINPL